MPGKQQNQLNHYHIWIRCFENNYKILCKSKKLLLG